jgi:mandelamide amidase
MRDSITQHDVFALVEALDAQELDLAGVVDGLLAQQRRWQHLNTVVAQDTDALRRAAAAPAQFADRALRGLPLIVKDNINTMDLPTSACTPTLRGNRPGVDAPVVARLRTTGALVFGKANMHELAFGITNNHGAFGAARNPYDPTRIPGGSSGGTAAAIAAGIVPAGLGTDTGGSVRIPAALCGICGLRPSHGRYSGEGVVPLSTTRDTVGPMARSVRDVALLDSVLAGEPPAPLAERPLKSLRLGVPAEHYHDHLDPPVAAVFERALETIAGAGVTLVREDIEDIADLTRFASATLVHYEVPRDLKAYLERFAPDVDFASLVDAIVSPDVQQAFAMVTGETASEVDYRGVLQQRRPRLQQAFHDYLDRHWLDALLIPATPLSARPIGEDFEVETGGVSLPTLPAYTWCCDPSSVAGIPSLALPAGLDRDGLPVGIMIEGRIGADRDLLATGKTLEALLGKLPPPAAPNS